MGDATAGQNAQAPFTLKEEPLENLRPMKVRVIGAGFSGILAAIRIPERIKNVDLVVYEKNDGVGGVWWMNRYPGITCDIPSHSYQYSFAPNPDWSNLYAPGNEIRQYLEGVAGRFGAKRFIKTSHQVSECVWDEDEKKCTPTHQAHKFRRVALLGSAENENVSLRRLEVLHLPTREVIHDDADVLLSARGQLNEPQWPEIPGLNGFKGKVLHSAEWDDTYDFRNKKVGIIGNGSSAIQIVPSLQRLEGTSLTVFARSKTWISPPFGRDGMEAELGLAEGVTEIPKEARELFRRDPQAWLRFRKAVEDGGNVIHDSLLVGTQMQRDGRAHLEAHMRARLARRPELADRVVPIDFAPGCRRLTPGPGFLEALTQDNVELVTAPIARIDAETGDVVLAPAAADDDDDKADGEANPRVVSGLDALVCATGFRTATAPASASIVGRGGLTLAQRWAARPESYLSVAVDGFPNFLILFGPNAAIGFGSLTRMLEAECDYAVRVIRKLQREDYATVEPRAERVRDFTAFVDAYFARTVHLDRCKSWYRSAGGRGDRIVGLWPGSTLHALEALRSPRWEDFLFEGRDPDGNRLRWLGNGWSVTETEGDPSWYINPGEVDWPLEGRPEDAKKYRDRPWSY